MGTDCFGASLPAMTMGVLGEWGAAKQSVIPVYGLDERCYDRVTPMKEKGGISPWIWSWSQCKTAEQRKQSAFW